MVLLMGRRFKGAIMVGILFVTFISWIPYHGATYFGEASQIKGGSTAVEGYGFVQVRQQQMRRVGLCYELSSKCDADGGLAKILPEDAQRSSCTTRRLV